MPSDVKLAAPGWNSDILVWCQARLESWVRGPNLSPLAVVILGLGDPCCTSHGLCAMRQNREMGYQSVLDFELGISLVHVSLSPLFPFMSSELNYKTTVWGCSSIDIKVLNSTPTTT